MVPYEPATTNGHISRKTDPSRLAPEDAFYAKRLKDGARNSNRRRKGAWKKLLWVKQSCKSYFEYHRKNNTNSYSTTDPDNYTDEDTFLDHLQRNPRLQPYEFWRLVADSTVIVQHVCSVTIFVCCFTGIFQERVSPLTVVSWGSFGTVVGWMLWDFWVTQEEKAQRQKELDEQASLDGEDASCASSTTSAGAAKDQDIGMPNGATIGSRPGSSHSMQGHPTGASTFAAYSSLPPYGVNTPPLSPRNQQRVATVKSAILIYCALLGLSPILKSLTKSTTSDSIWAMSTWLMCINVAFFDYGGGVGAK
jgi:phosphatidylinositol glycan class C protein